MSPYKEIKVLISMPSSGNPAFKTLQSMTTMGCLHKYHYIFHYSEGTLIHRSRNQAVWTAVEQKCSHLMFIDDDMVFPHDAVDTLIERNKNIIGALCYGRKVVNNKPIIKRIEGDEIKDMSVDDVPTWEEPFKVGTTGTGFLLINMDVFKYLQPPFFYYSDPKEFGMRALPFPNNELSEDTTFMMNARKAGFEIWVDPTIEIGHVGEKVFKREDTIFADNRPMRVDDVTKTTAIFIPTVNRVDNIKALIPNIEEMTPEPHTTYIMTQNEEILKFCAEFKNVKAIKDEGTDIRYVTRMNKMYKMSTEDYMFTCADDVVFHKGWLSNAMTGLGKYKVIGVNDMYNPAATMFLIDREYIDKQSGCLDTPGVIFYPGYQHNFCDVELICTSMKRKVYTKVGNSIVEHKHWRNGQAKHDETYVWADERLQKDQGLYLSRKDKFKFPNL